MSPTPRQASLARRALPALVLAGASAALLVRLDQQGGEAAPLPVKPQASGGGSAAPTTPRPTSPSAPTTVPGRPGFGEGGFGEGGFDDGDGQAPPGFPGSGQQGPTGPSGQIGQSGPSGQPSSPGPTVAPACQGTTVAGPEVESRFGPFQVQATFGADGALCDVQAIEWPQDRRSSRINAYALPILHDEVMAAKSTNIDVVSGATITSYSYAQSLQAILDGRK